MQSLVMKFGGTSLGDARRIASVADAVADARSRGAVAVVVSAMAGVTDRLVQTVEVARTHPVAAREQVEAIIANHRETAVELGIGTIEAAPWSLERVRERLLESLPRIAANDHRAVAIVLASGEKLSAWLLLGSLCRRGVGAAIVPAEVLIRTCEDSGHVEVDGACTRENIRARGDAFWRPRVRIVPGFTGAGADAHTTTLGRNASDVSAAWLAASLGWALEIWTDVAGCYSADPRHVPGARLLRRLSLHDAHRFARAGASVIHARTLEPLLAHPVSLSIVNSFAAHAERTRIGGPDSNTLRGVACRDDLRLLRGARACAAGEVFDRGRDVTGECVIAVLDADAACDADAESLSVISVFDDAVGATLVQRCRQALADAQIDVSALWWSPQERAVRVAVAHDDAQLTQRLLHREFVAGVAVAPVHLAVIGASGRVAGRLLALIDAQSAVLRARGIEMQVIAVAGSRSAHVRAEGIPIAAIAGVLGDADPMPIAPWSAELLARPERPLVVLDCTASAAVAARYPEWLSAGFDIVTPNKHGPAADRDLINAINAARCASGARFLHETAVGAQLPLLRTLRELGAAGDRIGSLEAVLSGTLSYVLARVREGCAFSRAVREAVDAGYAEPHPGADLSGADAARKLVILLRANGIDIDIDAVGQTPLVEARALQEADTGKLLGALAVLDAHWRNAARSAAEDGECWIHCARFADGVASIGPLRVALSHPLARLLPCENAVRLTSTLYRDAPLTISGPGAGIDLTAAGVFADLLEVAAARTALSPLRTGLLPAGERRREVA